MNAQASVVNASNGLVLASKATFALTHRERTRGLIGRPGMEAGEALVIPRCRHVHTFGMSFAIDVALLERSGEVVKVSSGLRPRRLSPLAMRAHTAIEFPAGTLELTGTIPGHTLLIIQ